MSQSTPSNPQSTTPGHVEFDGIPTRLHAPETPLPSGARGYPTLVMLHGFRGMEDVTWIFAKSARLEWLVASPRAPFTVDFIGTIARSFSWYNFDTEGHTDPATLQVGLQTLRRFLISLNARYLIDPQRFVILGFSQGAAMAYAYALTNPVIPPSGVVSLGGFIPGVVAKSLPVVNDLPVLIIHGTEDDTIAVALAQKNRDQLIAAGANVTYHEEAVGHRVGTAGMRVLASWLAERLG